VLLNASVNTMRDDDNVSYVDDHLIACSPAEEGHPVRMQNDIPVGGARSLRRWPCRSSVLVKRGGCAERAETLRQVFGEHEQRTAYLRNPPPSSAA
jgi:hypothetical protein